MNLFSVDIPKSEYDVSYYVVANTSLHACQLMAKHLVAQDMNDPDDAEVTSMEMRVFNLGPSAAPEGVMAWEGIEREIISPDKIHGVQLSVDSDERPEIS